MKRFRVEFGFGENFETVEEFQTMDGLDVIEAENAEEAVKWAACTDGLENALFLVYELVDNGLGDLEKTGEVERFCFN